MKRKLFSHQVAEYGLFNQPVFAFDDQTDARNQSGKGEQDIMGKQQANRRDKQYQYTADQNDHSYYPPYISDFLHQDVGFLSMAPQRSVAEINLIIMKKDSVISDLPFLLQTIILFRPVEPFSW